MQLLSVDLCQCTPTLKCIHHTLNTILLLSPRPEHDGRFLAAGLYLSRRWFISCKRVGAHASMFKVQKLKLFELSRLAMHDMGH